MYVRIYAKTEEEYNELIAKFKENMWIRVNGYVKNNPFYNDFVLNARNIEKIDSKLEEIKDLEEKWRCTDADICRCRCMPDSWHCRSDCGKI